MPKPAPACRVEAGRDGGSCRRILPQQEAPNAFVRDISAVQEIEKVARDGACRLGEVDEPVDGFGELGGGPRGGPQLGCEEMWVSPARARRARRGARHGI